MNKLVSFLGEIANIMYVGGILSHIVIGAMCAGANVEFIYSAYLYKQTSMYALIIPGLILKILCDLYLYFYAKERAYWFYIKSAMLLILTFNAVVFLIPMMPQMIELAKLSADSGVLSQEFLQKEKIEMIVGQSNALLLLIEILMGAFKPKIRGR